MKKLMLVCAALAAFAGFAGTTARIVTSAGTIELALDAEKAPITVKNFAEYAKSGHYDGTVFHRVIKGFMIQGGGFTRDMAQKPTREPIKNEAANGLKNRKYTIAMARTQVVDSATSQFFINVNDNAFLDYRAPNAMGFGYAVFGEVTKGQEVVDKIAEVATGSVGFFQDVPKTPIVIEKVTVSEEVVKADPKLFETIFTRGSCRQFDATRPVSDADIEKILRCAMCAPTAMDRRPWEFVVVRDKAKLAALAQKAPNCRVGNGAQVAIIVCGSLDNGLPGRGKEFWMHDCAAASMNILLAAHGLGLGAVWTAGYPSEERVAAIREVVGVPEGYAPLNIIPLGYPKEPVQPKDKWNPAKIHNDQW